MSTLIRPRSSFTLAPSILAVAAALFMWVLDREVAVRGLDLKMLMTLVIGAAIVPLLLGGTRSQWVLFCIGVVSIALGHRGVYLGHWTYLVPFQVLLFLLFAVLLAHSLAEPEAGVSRVPVALTFLTVWCLVLAAVRGLMTNDWDDILAWTLPMATGWPAFWVVRRLVRQPAQLHTILRLLLGATAAMSVLALAEYLFPALHTQLPWLFTASSFQTQDGFVRAAFSFFGYPAAASIVACGGLLAYRNGFVSRSLAHRLGAGGLFLLIVMAVYVSGQRSAWFAFAVALILLGFSLGSRGWLGAALLLPSIALLPGVFWSRLDTILHFVRSGSTQDTSTLSRLDRWQWAWDAITNHPLLGAGYGHELAHNAFLEVGATIGLLPAIALVFFVALLIFRLVRAVWAGRTAEERGYGWLFLAMGAIWITQMCVETVFQTPPLAVAYWLMIAVAWYAPEILAQPIRQQEPTEAPSGAGSVHP